MNKLQFHRIIIGALVLLNIFLIYQLLNKRHGHSERMGGRGPKNMIIKTLDLDEKQVSDYENLIEQHQDKIKKLDGDITKIKHEILQQLSEMNPDIQDTLYQEIGKLQAKIEQAHFQHFLAIKTLCREDQLDGFGDLSKRLIDVCSKRKNKARKRRSNF